MPQFIISATGGNYTDATTWQDSVVPTSATSSDIVGLSFSGPLYLNNLGTRIVGDFDLTEYENILGFTGSSTVLQVRGGTFSLGTNMTFSGNVGTGLANNQVIQFLPNIGKEMEVTLRGNTLSKCNIRFGSQNTSKIKVMDEMYLEAPGIVSFHGADGTGLTFDGFAVGSGTAGVPAEIKIDPRDTVSGYTFQGSRTMGNRGYEANIRIVGTGSGTIGFSGGIGSNYGVPYGATFILEGSGMTNQESGFTLGFHNKSGFKYVSGTYSPYTRFTCISSEGTYQAENVNEYRFDTTGFNLGIIDMRNGTTTAGKSMKLQPLNDNFTIQALQFLDLTNNAGQFIVGGTGSNVNINQIFPIPQSVSLRGYTTPKVFFEGGLTYSLQRLVYQGNVYNEFGGDGTGALANPTYSVIAATGTGNATIKLLRDENTVSGCNIRDIDFTDNTLYAFGSITSNTTGVLTSYPTGGTGGGGEVSFTFLS
jgi:hypothetical protein